MIIRRERRYTVNMAQYESYNFGAAVELSHHDLGISDAALVKTTLEQRKDIAKKLTAKVLAELATQLSQEIEDACELTSNQKSFLRKAFGYTPIKRGSAK
jgi:hypothetical protein